MTQSEANDDIEEIKEGPTSFTQIYNAEDFERILEEDSPFEEKESRRKVKFAFDDDSEDDKEKDDDEEDSAVSETEFTSERSAAQFYQRKYEEAIKENETLRQVLQLRQEVFINREKERKTEIERLQNQLNDAVLHRKSGGSTMEGLRKLKQQIIDTIEDVEGDTQNRIKARQNEMTREYQIKMTKLKNELESEIQAHQRTKEQTENETKQLREELEDTLSHARKLDQLLVKEKERSQRHRIDFEAQDGDRYYLVKENAQLKKQNERLKKDLNSLKESPLQHNNNSVQHESYHSESLEWMPSVHDTSDQNSSVFQQQRSISHSRQEFQRTEQHYIKQINRMKKKLAIEKNNAAHYRDSLLNYKKKQSEIQLLLEECIDDIHSQISNSDRYNLKEHERQKLMNLLFSKQSILTNLLEIAQEKENTELENALNIVLFQQ
eukprot:gb/GECH01006114.1/.p1 GENE.gb/GECH01006114.1/~~gb/GECH01006114.1/.p1  ORF type:complete len:437 (+),score=129.65 gb/GECH01006114.1/:1-1311(+)